MATGSHDPRLPGNVIGLPGVDIDAIVDQLRQGSDGGRAGGDDVTHASFGGRDDAPQLLAPGKPVVFTVRVELGRDYPPVWRRLEVAGSVTLGLLHRVLQAAMGWADQHLHAFTMVAGSEPTRPTRPFLTDVDVAEGEAGLHEDDVRLDEVVARVGDRLDYVYDFGDGWEHTIVVEAVRPVRKGEPLARCLAGERACPLENAGGGPGHDEVVEAYGRDGHDDAWLHENLAWIPPDYDPEVFDRAKAEAALSAALDASADLAALRPEVVQTVERLDQAGRTRVEPWCRAVSRASADVDASLAGQLMAPWLALLEHVGEGLRLTAAGYLRPATVTALIASLRVGYAADVMFGKGNREEHVRPIGALHRSATAMGLVRKAKGSLHLTKAGREGLADPAALMRHVARRLPLGRAPHEQEAGRLVLLAAAAGSDASYPDMAELLGAAGWLVDGAPPPRYAAVEWARDTYDVLGLAGWNVNDAGVLRHDPRAALLAVLAVRG